MRIRLLGGFAVEHDGAEVAVSGVGQRGLLFRLAIDAGSAVSYRAIAEDLWPDDLPENPRASLQSLVSRLRAQLPVDVVESVPGGYRIAIARDDVDAVRFQDLVTAASGADPGEAARLASEALKLWLGEPWTPGEGYDWFERAIADDRATALRLGSGSVPPVRSSIPAALTELVGRESELASVRSQLESSRLVTLLGAGGAGKTRLAIEIARAQPGAVLVELAPAGPDELWQAIVGAIGREFRVGDFGSTGPTSVEQITVALDGRSTLLVLDNCEHLIQAAADAAHELLSALPRLRVLATSREPLGVPGEAFVPLGPLSEQAAAKLFDQRVASARGDGVSPLESHAAERIRSRLDGLPLALELAAAKSRTMTLEEIAVGLDDRFSLLGGGLRTVLPRHQTLRALIDWSWDLLTPGERTALTVLAAYPAGVATAEVRELGAAHGISGSDVDALVDKSLLRRSSGRYRALETIREYGLEKLAEAGQVAQVRSAQAERIAVDAEAHDAILRGPRIFEALAWFDGEDDNIAAALRYSVDAGLESTALRLGAAIAWYWIIRDRNDDAMTWLAALREFAERDESDAAALILAAATISTAFQEGSEGAGPPDPAVLDEVERVIDKMRGRRGDLVEILPLMMSEFMTSLRGESWPVSARFPSPSDLDLGPWAAAMLETVRAAMAQNRGDVAELGETSEHAVAAFTEIGDVWGLALAWQMRSEWLVLQGRLEEALALSDESTDAMREITSTQDLLQQQGLAVSLLQRLGRVDEARDRIERMLVVAEESGSPRSMVQAGTAAAGFYAELGELERADELLTPVDSLAEEWEGLPPQLGAMIALVRARLVEQDDPDAVRGYLERAASEAVRSSDHPVMAMVAIGIGRAALTTGDLDTAAQGLALGRALRGAPDPTEPAELALMTGLEAAGVDLDRLPAAPDRSAAAEQLAQILRR